MTTCLGKGCSFGLPRVYVFSYFPFGFEGRVWDLIVSVPDHCLSFYFVFLTSFSYVLRTCIHIVTRTGFFFFNILQLLLELGWFA